jgi:CheY-like chemotaxis protein
LIAVTASLLAEEKKLCYDAGFDDILPKPFKRPDIEAMFNKWVSQQPAAEQLPTADQSTAAGQNKTNASAGDVYNTVLTKNNQVFNGDELMDTFMQSAETAKSLLSHYLERSTEQLEALPALTKEKNWEEAHRFVHSIKGSARTLSGMELGNAAAVMEIAYKYIDLPKIESSMPALYEAFERFKIAAGDFLQT